MKSRRDAMRGGSSTNPSEALYGAVRDGMLQGKTLETLHAEIRLPGYSHLRRDEAWHPLKGVGVYETFVETSYFNFRRVIYADGGLTQCPHNQGEGHETLDSQNRWS